MQYHPSPFIRGGKMGRIGGMMDTNMDTNEKKASEGSL
jgi:hypothetical protein